MPKINQEEYEVLQFLNNTKDWIVRNPDGQLWAVGGEAPRKSPFYETWKEGDGQDVSKVDVSSFLFQFIQWEDEEPYSITELIEEYEESEEKEVKNIEWLKEKVKEEHEYNRVKHNKEGFEGYAHREFVFKYVLDLLDQLDEPEVLSQEWIDEHKENWQDLSVTGYSVPEKDLQNILVPRQELPVIPQFVADYIKDKEEWMLFELFDENYLYDDHPEIAKWLYDNDSDINRERELLLVQAKARGYKIEQEPKYFVDDKKHALLCKWKSEDGWKVINTSEAIEDDLPIEILDYGLTEQEIKDYDERFWPFAVKVEELEE